MNYSCPRCGAPTLMYHLHSLRVHCESIRGCAYGHDAPRTLVPQPDPTPAPVTVGMAPLSRGASDVLAERRKQIAKWGETHDDEHDTGQLVWNALECANYAIGYEIPLPNEWGLGEKHKGDRRRLLVIASALLIAEIERIDRGTP